MHSAFPPSSPFPCTPEDYTLYCSPGKRDLKIDISTCKSLIHVTERRRANKFAKDTLDLSSAATMVCLLRLVFRKESFLNEQCEIKLCGCRLMETAQEWAIQVDTATMHSLLGLPTASPPSGGPLAFYIPQITWKQYLVDESRISSKGLCRLLGTRSRWLSPQGTTKDDATCQPVVNLLPKQLSFLLHVTPAHNK